MSTHEQTYLTCNLCSKPLIDCNEVSPSNAAIIYGETADCVRGKATNLGWRCGLGMWMDDVADIIDICEDCLAKIKDT